MPTPYYQDDAAGITLYHGNCLDMLPAIGPVDAVITDPPYGVNLKYSATFADTPEVWAVTTPPIVEYAIQRGILCAVFGAAPTLVRDVLLFPHPPERVLIWAPSFTLSSVQKNCSFYRYHLVYTWNLPQKRNDGPAWDVLREPCEGVRKWWNHPGTKPVRLMKQLVGLVPRGGIVLDPFAGSGSTLVAARASGRRAIGIELDEEHCKIIVGRLTGRRPDLDETTGLPPLF